METQAVLRGARLSAQKGRLIAGLIRGKSVAEALDILTFCPKKGAELVKKVLPNHETSDQAIRDDEHDGVLVRWRARGGLLDFSDSSSSSAFLLLFLIIWSNLFIMALCRSSAIFAVAAAAS